mmetsp:Transcript_10316/g.21743  ORF Transcript_10316/g.21743 Transcript_10316/m.21743 type:complete len:220 (-) Transcript_10316:300-959(-)
MERAFLSERLFLSTNLARKSCQQTVPKLEPGQEATSGRNARSSKSSAHCPSTLRNLSKVMSVLPCEALLSACETWRNLAGAAIFCPSEFAVSRVTVTGAFLLSNFVRSTFFDFGRSRSFFTVAFFAPPRAASPPVARMDPPFAFFSPGSIAHGSYLTASISAVWWNAEIWPGSSIWSLPGLASSAPHPNATLEMVGAGRVWPWWISPSSVVGSLWVAAM